jgi:ribonuclease VapC
VTIAVDASALVAIGWDEPERDDFLAVLGEANNAFVAPINYVETGVVLINRGRLGNKGDFDRWLGRLGVEIHGGDDLAGPALAAYLAWGRGFHPARLNLADCFAYALAKQLDAPLLYKGEDFPRTDIRSALQPT